MKNIFLKSIAIVFTLLSISCSGQNTNQTKADTEIANKVEVYYFHFTRRCFTCNLVESETKKALETLYANELKSGKVVFSEINLDDKEHKELAQKYQVSSSALIVAKGDDKKDLTMIGFMNANKNPKKLEEELKKAIDSYLK